MCISSSDHKSSEQLQQELANAQKHVKTGGIYSHYKNPQHTYKVLALGVQEATDHICVIYQALYDNQVIFVRDLENWLEKPTVHGEKVERFQLVK